MLLTLVISVFPALLVLAAVFDLLTMTIPNRLSLALIAGFLAAAALSAMPLEAFGLHLLAGAVALVVGFACFSFGWIGGGDAKLAAAASLWIGWAHLLEYAVVFSVYGGVLTVLVLLGRAMPMSPILYRAEWLARLHDRRSGIPYGIALAIAALVIFPKTTWHGAWLLG